jgi:AraC-like DNA-binding protein
MMNREQFRKEIQALSPAEIRLKNGEDLDKSFYDVLEKNGYRNADGYYYFPDSIKSVMKTVRSDEGPLRKKLFESALQNRLRLILNQRFSRDRMHYDSFIGINYVYSGELTVCFPDRTITLEKGQLCLMDENVVHSYKICHDDDLILSLQMDRGYINSSFLYGLSGNNPVADLLMDSLFGKKSRFTYSVFDCSRTDRMRLVFEDLFCEYIEPGILSTTIVENFMKLFFTLLVRDSGTVSGPETDIVITRILKYIDDHYSSCTLEMLSKEFRYSPKYISRLIKNRTGSSLTDLITGARMTKICFLLVNTNRTVEEIASMCGYLNLNFFYRKFREIYHTTPALYRKNSHFPASSAVHPKTIGVER